MAGHGKNSTHWGEPGPQEAVVQGPRLRRLSETSRSVSCVRPGTSRAQFTSTSSPSRDPEGRGRKGNGQGRDQDEVDAKQRLSVHLHCSVQQKLPRPRVPEGHPHHENAQWHAGVWSSLGPAGARVRSQAVFACFCVVLHTCPEYCNCPSHCLCWESTRTPVGLPPCRAGRGWRRSRHWPPRWWCSQFSCAAPTLSSCPEPAPEVWVCNSDGYVGQVCLLSLRAEPDVEACIAVCSARILCIGAVPGLQPHCPR